MDIVVPCFGLNWRYLGLSTTGSNPVASHRCVSGFINAPPAIAWCLDWQQSDNIKSYLSIHFKHLLPHVFSIWLETSGLDLSPWPPCFVGSLSFLLVPLNSWPDWECPLHHEDDLVPYTHAYTPARCSGSQWGLLVLIAYSFNILKYIFYSFFRWLSPLVH